MQNTSRHLMQGKGKENQFRYEGFFGEAVEDTKIMKVWF
jgi:hypothetical protein